eukprot:15180560-Heterocapsa_arctica.AAC.1
MPLPTCHGLFWRAVKGRYREEAQKLPDSPHLYRLEIAGHASAGPTRVGCGLRGADPALSRLRPARTPH